VIGDAKGNYTATFGGTSSACPGAAGTFALMLAANPQLTLPEVREIVKSSCDKIDAGGGSYDANGHSIFYGYGRLNAAKAVQLAVAVRKKPDTVFRLSGLASLNIPGDAAIEDGVMLNSQPANTRVIGFQINLAPADAGLSLQYQAFTSAPGPSVLQNAGAYAGTRDRRRKLTGFRLQLGGELAANYDIFYQAGFDNNKRSIEVQNGALCGVDKSSGKAITRLWVRVVRKT
jgi:hypothetical protein